MNKIVFFVYHPTMLSISIFAAIFFFIFLIDTLIKRDKENTPGCAFFFLISMICVFCLSTERLSGINRIANESEAKANELQTQIVEKYAEMPDRNNVNYYTWCDEVAKLKDKRVKEIELYSRSMTILRKESYFLESYYTGVENWNVAVKNE